MKLLVIIKNENGSYEKESIIDASYEEGKLIFNDPIQVKNGQTLTIAKINKLELENIIDWDSETYIHTNIRNFEEQISNFISRGQYKISITIERISNYLS